MFYSDRIKRDLKDSGEIKKLQSNVEQVRKEEKIDEQNFHQDRKKLFESTTKAVGDSSKRKLEVCKFTKEQLR